MGVRSYFTPVVGNEVTTSVGHFNAFPFAPGEPLPDAGLTEWPALLRSIRSANSERVVVLNHPRDLHAGYRPFDPANFNQATGALRRWDDVVLDGVEAVNSGALQTDQMQPFRDWFALLNHGRSITAVGSSDSHDVSRFIVGQGRTYVACADDDPARIDVAAACRSVRTGRAIVSLGLFVDLEVDGRFHVGDVARPAGSELTVTAKVLGPSWVKADRVELFANGVKIRGEAIEAPASAIEKARIEWRIPKPAADTYLVAIASGLGISAPHWPMPRPYQHSSTHWEPRVIGATNPIWIDADGDGRYTSILHDRPAGR
jgi:hypothetical protein